VWVSFVRVLTAVAAPPPPPRSNVVTNVSTADLECEWNEMRLSSLSNYFIMCCSPTATMTKSILGAQSWFQSTRSSDDYAVYMGYALSCQALHWYSDDYPAVFTSLYS